MTQAGGNKNNLPVKLGKPARRALEGAGYVRIEQLTDVTEAELLKLHGIGPSTIEPLRQALADKGLSFAQHKR